MSDFVLHVPLVRNLNPQEQNPRDGRPNNYYGPVQEEGHPIGSNAPHQDSHSSSSVPNQSIGPHSNYGDERSSSVPNQSSGPLSNYVVDKAFLVKESCIDLLLQCFLCIWCHKSSQSIGKSFEGGCLSATVYCPVGHEILRWSSRYPECIKTQREIYQCPPSHPSGQPWTSLEEPAGSSTTTVDSPLPSHEESRPGTSKMMEMVNSEVQTDDFPAVQEGSVSGKFEELGQTGTSTQDQACQSTSSPGPRCRSPLPPIHTTPSESLPPPPQPPLGKDTTEDRTPNEVPGVPTLPHRGTEKRFTPAGKQKNKHVIHHCTACSKQFALKCNLRLHEQMHSMKKYQTFFAKESSRRFLAIGRTSRQVHSGREPFSCQACHKRFPTMRQRQFHQRFCEKETVDSASSTGQEAFRCHYCLKTFRDDTRLDQHRRRHLMQGAEVRASVTSSRWYKEMRGSLSHRNTTGKSSSADSQPPSFSCIMCGKILNSAVSLRVHKATHAEAERFPCGLCPREFPNSALLNHHLGIHTRDRPHQCRFCSRVFAHASNCRQHEMLDRGDRPYQCLFCGDRFRSNKGRIEHLGQSHPGMQAVKCKFCSGVFSSDEACRLHALKHSLPGRAAKEQGVSQDGEVSKRAEDDETDKLLEARRQEIVDGDEDPQQVNEKGQSLHEVVADPPLGLHCRVCCKAFSSKDQLDTHQRLHAGSMPFKCSYCPKSFVQPTVLEWHEEHHQFECDICGVHFSSHDLLEGHRRMHPRITKSRVRAVLEPVDDDDMYFGDDYAEYSDDPGTDTSDDHNDTDPDFTIAESGDIGSSRENAEDSDRGGDGIANRLRERGQQTTASTSRAVPKPAPKQDPERAAMTTERRSDDGRKVGPPFICKICDQPFKHKASLNRHCREVHRGEDGVTAAAMEDGATEGEVHHQGNSGTDSFPYKCRYCGKTFRQPSARSKHEKIHTDERPFQCEVCQKAFKTQKNMREHSLVHSDERPFSCDVCYLTFKRNSALHRHRRRHTGDESVHGCDVCEAKFEWVGELREHKKTHSEDGAEKGVISDDVTAAVSGDEPTEGEVHHQGNSGTDSHPYNCRYCGKTFHQQWAWSRHEKIHTVERPFQCEVCQKAFKTKKILQDHGLVHSNARPFTCDVCDLTFKRGSALHRHKRGHSGENGLHGCDVCDAKFEWISGLMKHKKTHSDDGTEKKEGTTAKRTTTTESRTTHQQNQRNENKRRPGYCWQCKVNFATRAQLAVHSRIHEKVVIYYCPHCDEGFPDLSACQIHLSTHLGETPFKCRYCDDSFAEVSQRSAHQSAHTEDFPHGCAKCEMKFATEHECRGHELLHLVTPYQCKICNGRFSFEEDRDEHQAMCICSKTRQCKYCGKNFDSWRLCKAHVDTHPEEKPFICATCGKTYKEGKDLRKHEGMHIEGTPHICTLCGKGFKTADHVLRHERRHTAPLAYKCSYCGRGFKCKNSQMMHERVHRGDKCYKCSYCDIRLTSITARKAHHMTHTGELPFKCETCQRLFRHNSSLTRHRRLHTGEKPYPCSICGEGFRDHRARVYHERKHTGERPYVCSYCGKTFRAKEMMRKHERTHTGEKPLKCVYCGEAFMYSTSRINHMKRSHPVEYQRERGQEGQSGPASTTSHRCLYCEEGFPNSTSRVYHTQRSHPVEYKRDQEQKRQGVPASTESTDMGYVHIIPTPWESVATTYLSL